MFVSPRLTNEEIYLAQKFARVALRTHNVTSFRHLVNRGAVRARRRRDGHLPRSREAQAILVVNSDARRRALRRGSDRQAGHPRRRAGWCTSGRRRTARREVRGDLPAVPAGQPRCSSLHAIVAEVAQARRPDGRRRSSWPTLWPACRRRRSRRRTGVEPVGDAEAAAKLLGEEPAKVMVFNRDYRGPRVAGDAALLAAARPRSAAALLPLHEKSNAQGLLDMGANPRWYPGYRPVTRPGGDRGPREGVVRVAARPRHRARSTWRACWPRRRSRSRWCSARTRSATEACRRRSAAGLEAAEFLVVADLFATEDGAGGARGAAAEQHARDRRAP